MKSIDEMKEKVYDTRIKHIEKQVESAMLTKVGYAEVGMNFITGAITEELLALGYKVEPKAVDPTVVVISW